MSEKIQIQFVGELDDRLTMSVLGYTHPQNTDYWDGNWINVEVNIIVGSFSADVSGAIRLDEIESFLTELLALQSTLSGKARFETMDGWLTFDIEGDKLGHTKISGYMKDSYALTDENVLKFTVKSDQSYLTNPIKALKRTLLQYPIRGKDS